MLEGEPKAFQPKILEEAQADPAFKNYLLDEMERLIEEEIEKQPDFLPAQFQMLGFINVKYAAALNTVRGADDLDTMRSVIIDLGLKVKKK